MKRFLNSLILLVFIGVILFMLFGHKKPTLDVGPIENDIKMDFNLKSTKMYYFEGNKINVHLIGIDEVYDNEKNLNEILATDEEYINTLISKFELVYEHKYKLDLENGSVTLNKCDNDIYITNNEVSILEEICNNSYTLKTFGEVVSIGDKTKILLSEKIIDLEYLEIPNNGYKLNDLVMIYYTMKNKPIVNIEKVVYYDFNKVKLEDYGIKMDYQYSYILSGVDDPFRVSEDYFLYFEEYFKKCDCTPLDRKAREINLYLPSGVSVNNIKSSKYDYIDYTRKGQILKFKLDQDVVYVSLVLKNGDMIVIVI